MKRLQDILYKVHLEEVAGTTDLEVKDIVFDSRKVEKGALFVAVAGTQVDGHQFIPKALELGAQVIVCQVLPEKLEDSITYIKVADSAEALGVMAANFYDNPSEKLTLVGVTGTNGKTTCVTLLYKLFRALGYNTGLLSTVENKINEEVVKATHTTPDAVGLNAMLAQMVKAECTHCFMEVSSHAVDQRRIAGLRFKGAVFTNISHDHLDYHKTFDAYIKAKKRFFDDLPKTAFSLVNGDDKRATVMLQNTKASKNFYALKTMGEFRGKVLSNTLQGLEMEIDNHDAWFRLIGFFNAYNLLAVYGVAMLLEEDPEEVLMAMSTLGSVSGRFDQVISKSEVIGIVDYAHTPDALQNVLETITDLKDGNREVITVVGCGGDRDRAKRPEMAKIACKYSDRVILTSDNPRSEDPSVILNEMREGVNPSHARKVLVIEDRREAIRTACSFANPHDVVLVAGKGHENYQEIKGVRHHFDDKEELLATFNLLEK